MRMMEHCIRCDADIFFNETDDLVKCGSCGATFAVTEFQREAAKLQKKQEEGKRAQAEVEAAQREKEAAQKALLDAVSALGSIQGSQVETEARLNAICNAIETDAQMRVAMSELLSALKSGQDEDRDLLTRIMASALAGQNTATEALSTLRKVGQLLLKGQNDIVALMQGQAETIELLQGMGMDEKKIWSLIPDIYTWSQTANQENVERLERVMESSDTLLQRQREMDEKLNRLETKLTETQAELKAFHGQWEAKQLQKLEQLYQQASGYQRDREFEKADALYAKVLAEGGEDIEVYWRRVLCHYGVEYQWDEIRAKHVPTLLQPDLTLSENLSVRRAFAASLTKANDEQREHYEPELGEIDGILEQYREIKEQVSCDVFISVKQESNGHMTSEANVASSLYDLIKGWGLEVFNSRRSQITGDYEPYIIAHLLTAKALIVVGSCRENMESQWVRNEWMRFQWLQKHDSGTERIMFCYLTNGMSPKDIPLALNPGRQAILDGITAHDAVRTNLEHLIVKKEMLHQADLRVDEGNKDMMQTILSMLLGNSKALEELKAQYRYLKETAQASEAAGMAALQPEKTAGMTDITATQVEITVEAADTPSAPEGNTREPVDTSAVQADDPIMVADLSMEEAEIDSEMTEIQAYNDAEADPEAASGVESSPQAEEEESLLLDDADDLIENISDAVAETDREDATETEEESPKADDTVSDEDTNEEADEEPHDDDDSFIFCDDRYGGIEIKKYCGNAEVLNIPSTICGKTVTSIGFEAFSNQKSLKIISIPEGVHDIGSGAFENCDNLETISIPESVFGIWPRAFKGCVRLAEISLPYGIDEISFKSFEKCLSLRHLRIPDSVEVIKRNAFSSSGIVSIDIPARVREIGQAAFCFCKELESIIIPDSVKVIQERAFAGCIKLKSIVIPLGVTIIERLAFSDCELLESVEIPSSVTIIDDDAFMNCKNLKKIIIPDSVTELGKGVFSGCEALQSVTISRNNDRLRKRTFENCKSLESVSIPNGVESIEPNVFLNCDRLKRVYIPDSVKVIRDEFLGCDKNLLIVGESSQSVQWWCINNNIAYDSPTVHERKAKGRCEYCGHRFNPFTKKCTCCSKPKSY